MNSGSCVDISIIIPLYKGQKFCTRLLNMINENCLYEELYKVCKVEVIFVNDYPDEEIVFENKKRYFNIVLVNQEKNSGIHASRIMGISQSCGEYIIMLDQDDLVKKNWLYSQWCKIISDAAHFCVCNGWMGRFRTLWRNHIFENRVNNLNYYLTIGNAICSPGQVIIKKKYLPNEWIENIQICNGADDFFLWIMVLKKGEKFSINDRYLYYHTPERREDSISDAGMVKSLREMFEILKFIDILKSDEIMLLNKQIVEKERLNSDRIIDINKYMKFHEMFHIMLKWMKVRNRGIGIDTFFKSKKYHNIAIYGLGYIGECIYEELCKSDIKVKYGIDYMALDFEEELPIVRIESELEEVDAIIITVIENKQQLIDILKEKVLCPIITTEEILDDIICM